MCTTQCRDCLDRHVSDWGKIKNIIKDSLSDFFVEAHEAQSHDSANYHGGITDDGPVCCLGGSTPVRDTAVMKTPGRIRGMDYEQ